MHSCPSFIRTFQKITAAILLALGTACTSTDSSSSPSPLPRAHSHNDYEQPRPLQDALEHGFCSVEADIFLVEGELLVGHTRQSLTRDKTLESLYLIPLRERCRRNSGQIHKGIKTLHLLIDIKTDAQTTYPVLAGILEKYSDILTSYQDGKIKTRAVTAILSGNRPSLDAIRAGQRFAAIDGRPEDLEKPAPASEIPWISQSWNVLFKWRGNGSLTPEESEKLKQLVHTTHAQGRQIRFWGLPDQPATWEMLWNAGVDWINTDKLTELRSFMLGKK